VTIGSSNIAIGIGAGADVTTGSDNIHIGNIGTLSDTNLIRIGTPGTQTSTFIAGIVGATPPVEGTLVVVNGNGQLGALTSSRRVKDEIRGMDEASAGLGKLRPVVFRYKAEPANGPRPLEYGLIAEEVAEIYPELVVHGTDGQPAGVKYHVLPAMLLNEFQRQQRQLESQAARLEAQQRELEELRGQVRALIGARASSLE
jgi:Chaperone of endosialidase